MIDPQLIPVLHAIQAGDKAHARRLLQPLLRNQPSAEAWYQASRVTETPAHEVTCLRRAIAMDPRHIEARQRLRSLQGDIMPSAQTVTSPLPVAGAESVPVSPMLSKEELRALRKNKQPKRKRGPGFYVMLVGVVLLSLCCTYFVLLIMGSGIPGRLRGFITGKPPVTHINGVPLEDVAGAVMLIPPAQSQPLTGADPAANVLEPGIVHEHTFSAHGGEEVVIGVQFFSPSADRVSRNIVILDPSMREVQCQWQRILQGDNGAMITCDVHQAGDWRMRILGIEGQSTGAYFVSIDRLVGDRGF